MHARFQPDARHRSPSARANFAAQRGVGARAARQETICDRVAANLETKALKCVIDRASWDQFLANEIKKPAIKRNDALSPANCGMSPAFFRNHGENEHMPGSDSDGRPVIAELQKKISTFKCHNM